MLKLADDKFLVEDVMELPRGAIGATRLHMDFETLSGNPKRPGDNPWAGDRICGAAVTWDNHPHAYYVPVRHSGFSKNLEVLPFQKWLHDVVTTCKTWDNQNVKFDAHFAAADGAEFRGRLFDTLTHAKLLDSDRAFGKGGYGLDALSADWLDAPIDLHDQEVQAFLQSIRSKDYADVPADIMGRYSCQDVLTARDLSQHERAEAARIITEQASFEMIWNLEQLVTPVLYDMEKLGFRVDETELQVKKLELLTFLIREQEELHKLCGYPIEPSNSADCYEVLCNRYGLPVLAWTDNEEHPNPSFDKHVLKAYLRHPDVFTNPLLLELVTRMIEYRKCHTMLTFFVEPYLVRQVGGRLHPSYNQLVRTGRMSSKKPNSQQLNPEAKMLVHPDTDDDAFLCQDGSQIEFRLIAEYCGDRGVIDAYQRDPDTDFHQWVADMCGIKRKPAKNVNFCVAYGGGKRKVLTMLAADMDLVGTLMGEVDKLIAEKRIPGSRKKDAFEALAVARAEQVYREYHDTLPGLRRVTNRAAQLCKESGFVFNRYGRRRHLPEKAAWRAFNSIVQGFASDIIKGGMVALSPRYCDWTRSEGIDLRINVHDEVVLHGPHEVLTRPDVQATTTCALENVMVPMQVPIRFECNVARRAWGKQETYRVERRLSTELPDARAISPELLDRPGELNRAENGALVGVSGPLSAAG